VRRVAANRRRELVGAVHDSRDKLLTREAVLQQLIDWMDQHTKLLRQIEERQQEFLAATKSEETVTAVWSCIHEQLVQKATGAPLIVNPDGRPTPSPAPALLPQPSSHRTPEVTGWGGRGGMHAWGASGGNYWVAVPGGLHPLRPNSRRRPPGGASAPACMHAWGGRRHCRTVCAKSCRAVSSSRQAGGRAAHHRGRARAAGRGARGLVPARLRHGAGHYAAAGRRRAVQHPLADGPSVLRAVFVGRCGAWLRLRARAPAPWCARRKMGLRRGCCMHGVPPPPGLLPRALRPARLRRLRGGAGCAGAGAPARGAGRVHGAGGGGGGGAGPLGAAGGAGGNGVGDAIGRGGGGAGGRRGGGRRQRGGRLPGGGRARRRAGRLQRLLVHHRRGVEGSLPLPGHDLRHPHGDGGAESASEPRPGAQRGGGRRR
jgi:hypothetical protein